MQLDGFTTTSFSHGGAERPVFRRGEGPAVVVMAEIPGITPEVAGFARTVADRGLTVWLPQMFGTPGQPRGPLNLLSSITHTCVSREFTVLARGQSSPITVWLRALCRHAHEACGGPGVGAIGMCITGNFALSLMVDPVVVAPVLSQPSLPFQVSPAHGRDLAISDDELAQVRQRAADGVDLLGLRFTHDVLCPAARFQRLRDELGERFEGIEVDSSLGNPWGHPPWAHSVVTNDLIDEAGQPTRAALDRVLAFFEERLLPG